MMNILQHHWFIHSAAAAAALGKRLTNGGVDCAPLLPSLLMLTASGLKTLKRVRPSVPSVRPSVGGHRGPWLAHQLSSSSSSFWPSRQVLLFCLTVYSCAAAAAELFSVARRGWFFFGVNSGV